MEEKKENPEELGIEKGNESEESNKQEKKETHGPSKRKLSRSSNEEEYKRGRKRIKISVKGEPVRDLGRKRLQSEEDGEQGVRNKLKTSSLGKTGETSSPKKCVRKRSRTSDEEETEEEQGKQERMKIISSEKCDEKKIKSNKSVTQHTPKSGPISSSIKSAKKRSRESDEEERHKQKMPKIFLEKEEENIRKQEEGEHKIHLEITDKPLSDHDKKHGVDECIAGTSGQIAVTEKVPFSQSLTGYDIHEVLGEGSFGKVMLASHKSTKQLVAIKMIRKTVANVVPVEVEERILQIARGSPFLCHGLTSFHTQTFSFLVMEYIRGGTLDSFGDELESLSITAFSFIAAELVCGIQFLHSQGIIHRDLKLDNIMLDHEGHVKISDFGLAAENIFGSNKAKGQRGTFLYMAPEVLAGKAYGASADWWSFGVVLFLMVTRQFPFDEQLSGLLYQQHVLTMEPRYPESLDGDLEDILRKLLAKDPDTRLGVTGNIREHRFFKDIDWEEVELCKARPPFQSFNAYTQSLLW